MGNKRKINNIQVSWDKRHLLQVLREKGPLAYNELYEESNIGGKGTFNDRLKKLEEEDLVTREWEPSERGRGKNLIKLTQKALDPVERALQRLKLVAGPHTPLDIDEGKELLTKSELDFLLQSSSIKPVLSPLREQRDRVFETFEDWKKRNIQQAIKTWGSYEEIPEPYRELYEGEPEFNECHLVVGLARYYLERTGIKEFIEERASYIVRDSFKEAPQLLGPESRSVFESREELKEFYEAENKNPELFPSLAIARKNGVIRKSDELLSWIRPLLEKSERWIVARDVKTSERKILPTAENLVAELFRRELRDYPNYVLKPAWLERARKSRSPMREEKGRKGGEKEE